MDETIEGVLIITAVVVASIGVSFMATNRKLDDQHGRTQEKLNDLRENVNMGQKALHDRLDREGKEALHGVTQLRVRFAELWNDRVEAFKQWWERQ